MSGVFIDEQFLLNSGQVVLARIRSRTKDNLGGKGDKDISCNELF